MIKHKKRRLTWDSQITLFFGLSGLLKKWTLGTGRGGDGGMDGGRGEEHNNQNQTNTSNKMEQTWQDTTQKENSCARFFPRVLFLLPCYIKRSYSSRIDAQRSQQKRSILKPLQRIISEAPPVCETVTAVSCWAVHLVVADRRSMSQMNCWCTDV